MNFKPIFYVSGILLLILSAMMIFPAFLDLADRSSDWKVFAGAQIVTAFIGFALIFVNRQKTFNITLRETFLLTSLSWVFMAAFGAVPLYLSKLGISYTDAFFEAMSAITTTGSTVLTGLDDMPRGILLWRHLMQWLGGIGFLVIALAVLPMLQVSGMQIYKTQSFGDIDKVLPSASQMAVYIFFIYVFLTVFWTVCMHFGGMSVFDALCHAMSAVSTAGFSTHDSSVGFFKSATIDWITIFAMISGALPFVLYLKFMRGDSKALWRDSQVRTFLGVTAVLVLASTLYLFLGGRFYFFDALRNASFMVTTLITTCGFANADYTVWGPFVVGIAFLTTFIGSCSGSTSGGIKIFRLQILWSMFKQQLGKLLSPHSVSHVYYNKKAVDAATQASIAGFFFIYIVIWALFGVALQLTGLDFTTAFSASITALSNVGPGLGNIIGPAGTFQPLPDDATWILSLAMLLGRLEFFTLLVLFSPRLWRD